MGEQWALRVAVYYESNDATDVQAWPPTDPDVPDTWGVNDYTMDAYEGGEPEPEEPEPEPEEPEMESPDASFTYSPLSPQENDTITFDASSCSDSDGQIVSYS